MTRPKRWCVGVSNCITWSNWFQSSHLWFFSKNFHISSWGNAAKNQDVWKLVQQVPFKAPIPKMLVLHMISSCVILGSNHRTTPTFFDQLWHNLTQSPQPIGLINHPRAPLDEGTHHPTRSTSHLPRDVVSFNSTLGALVNSSCWREALELFREAEKQDLTAVTPGEQGGFPGGMEIDGDFHPYESYLGHLLWFLSLI